MKEFSFKSSSSDATYTAVLNDNGVITCNCPGYTMRKVRECKHTKKVASDEGLPGRDLKFSELQDISQSSFIEAPSGFITPMLASGDKSERSPDDFPSDRWVAEEKFDGHRLIVKVEGSEVTAWSRQGNIRPLSSLLHAALGRLAEGIYDGELIIPGGTSTDVKALTLVNSLELRLFDILKVRVQQGPYMNVMSLVDEERRHMLELAVKKQEDRSPVQLATRFAPTAKALHDVWQRHGEGLIVKRLASTYTPGRSKDWVKFKTLDYAELTITGFEEGRLGPHSMICLRDREGVEITVKTKNDKWRAVFAARASAFIGTTVAISFQERTRDGRYRHPMVDHFPGGEL